MNHSSSHSTCDHWTECDRPSCPNDGQAHVVVPGHERPLWLCSKHEADVKAGRNPEAAR